MVLWIGTNRKAGAGGRRLRRTGAAAGRTRPDGVGRARTGPGSPPATAAHSRRPGAAAPDNRMRPAAGAKRSPKAGRRSLGRGDGPGAVSNIPAGRCGRRGSAQNPAGPPPPGGAAKSGPRRKTPGREPADAAEGAAPAEAAVEAADHGGCGSGVGVGTDHLFKVQNVNVTGNEKYTAETILLPLESKKGRIC